MDVSEFRKRGKEVIDAIADYYEGLDDRPPMSTVQPGYLYKIIPHSAPEEGESFDAIQKDMQTKIMPGMTHWQSGNFFSWFPSNSSFPAMLGDMYSSMFDVVGFNWLCSPAATELETVVMDWLCKLLGLDSRFRSINDDGTEGTGGGVIQGSASEAHVVSMLAARERALATGQRVHTHKLVAYFSDQTHSSGQKAASIVGCSVHTVATNSRFEMTRDALAEAIASDRAAGLVPFFVCGTFGTTNTTAVDDLAGIAEVAEREALWVHVDAAYAGAALCCPEFRPAASGIERADSFNFNPHKWMLTNFDCSALWVADSTHLTNALSISREYYPRVAGDTAFVKDYRNWQLPLGRRFRALKLWFVMRMYGASGIRKHIREDVEQAKWLEAQLRADGRFEIVAPAVFGLVVFRLAPEALATSSVDVANEANAKLVREINGEGKVFLLGSNLKGMGVVRAAIGSTYGTMKNVELLLSELKDKATRVVQEQC